MKLWAKFFCEEGVLWEKKFSTEADAEACAESMRAVIDELDEENDFYSADVDDKESGSE